MAARFASSTDGCAGLCAPELQTELSGVISAGFKDHLGSLSWDYADIWLWSDPTATGSERINRAVNAEQRARLQSTAEVSGARSYLR